MSWKNAWRSLEWNWISAAHNRELREILMGREEITFAGFPSCSNLDALQADIALIGIPLATPYDPEKPSLSRNAPGIIRHESNRYENDPVAWDFDLNGTLLGESGAKVADCGNLPVSQMDAEGNHECIREAITSILKAGAVPVVLGGDDSVPISVMRAYENSDPFTVLQLDAHIDWRDSVGGIRDGYSSTMRRASELKCVKSIVQVGMRGVGSARKEELTAALDYGARIITAQIVMRDGAERALKELPEGENCFLTIDLDVLDPSIMPAVGAPTPGGLDYWTLIEIIQETASRNRIVGVCLVEFVPEADLHNLGAITAMRVVWNVVGAVARALR
jgi:agmatinase